MTAHDHEREILRQAGIALGDRVVTLWEISQAATAIPLASSVAEPRPEDIALDLNGTLRRWGAPIIGGSRWVGCLVDSRSRWCVAPVRARPAAPPPTGTERRSRERLVLELAGLGIGALAPASGVLRRLPPADALWEFARQPSVIAHEVGNPLTVALGNLEISVDTLRTEATWSAAMRATLMEDLARVAQGIEQAADYLRSIQDRPFAGAGKLGRFDAMPIVRSCVILERPIARRDGVALQLESAVKSIYLYGDSSALYQVITNLLRNAVDASRGRAAIVTVHVEQRAEMLFLAVHDSGVGIAADVISRIFESGFTTKAIGKGSGIGLAVVKQLTENMFGGKIDVESRPGRGSIFTLALPIPPQRTRS